MIVAAGAVSSYNIDKKICHTGGIGLCRLTENPHKLI